MLRDEEFKRLLAACKALPKSGVIDEEAHVFGHPVLIAMSTVLTLERRWYRVALPARQRFESNRTVYCQARTLQDFRRFCREIIGPHDDYLRLAQKLWQNKEKEKARQLVELVEYFIRWISENASDLDEVEGLQKWARSTTADDFLGRIRGLGPRAFEQLCWYLQDGTAIKLDRHVRNFIEKTVGRSVPDAESVSELNRVAERLGVAPTSLDARIWEYTQAKGV